MSDIMISPGLGTGRFKVGTKFLDIALNPDEILSTEDRDTLTVYKTDQVWIFVSHDTGEIEQLSFMNGYEGKVLGKVGLGDSLNCVYREFGKCTIDNKVHEPVDYPGVTFEMENGSKAKTAKIEVISIMKPYKFLGELPEHIKNNLGGSRNLP